MLKNTLKTTLVLLPGLNGTAGLFEPLMESAREHFSLLPVSYPTTKPNSYSELTSYVLAEIEKVEGEFVLVGESFSGPIALFVAEKKPPGLRGVVLVATFVTAPNYSVGKYLPWGVGFTLAKPIYKVHLALSRDFRAGKKYSIMSSISRELQKIPPHVLKFRIQEIFTVDATKALRNCEYPLVYFRGLKDLVVPKKNLKKILSLKPSVKVVEFNTQHFLLQSKPEQAVAELKIFESGNANLNKKEVDPDRSFD